MDMIQTKSSVARDVFAYLLTFVMLYIGVVSFIALLWQIINVQFPDPALFYYQGSYDAMRNAIASLIVVWPVFLLMSRFIHKDISAHHEKADIWVRRWLTYLTIFVAAVTMIIDLITLINTFLNGELTLPFVLKALTVVLVAGAVLGYEFWDLKRAPSEHMDLLRVMSMASAALVVIAMAAGFFFVGSPSKARDIRLDNQRQADLQAIQYQIIDFWNRTKTIPAAINDLSDPITGYTVPRDPLTQAAYEYIPSTDLRFQLCATFARETPAGDSPSGVKYPATYSLDRYGNMMTEDWKHTSGRVCFDRTIDPKRHAWPT